ncbi:hypothetical protein [Streptomyces sp. NBC_00212]|uniref:hypothetical protein n=1 Tax=Streptomyces sp. NBC_00212 TaxID=2975684 RepID=UPI00324CB1F9
MQWLTAGYALPLALGLITGGRLGDTYGQRRVFLIGTAVFTLASLLCGILPMLAPVSVGPTGPVPRLRRFSRLRATVSPAGTGSDSAGGGFAPAWACCAPWT